MAAEYDYNSSYTGEQIDAAIKAVRENADSWSAKQDALTFDASPTNGSTNPVRSSGIYAAILAAKGIIATVETSTVASKAYAAGDYFVYNNALYKATAAISRGGTISVGTNCVAFDLTDGFITADERDLLSLFNRFDASFAAKTTTFTSDTVITEASGDWTKVTTFVSDTVITEALSYNGSLVATKTITFSGNTVTETVASA